MASFKTRYLLAIIVTQVAILHLVVSQNGGEFPQPVTIAINKPVSASSTCGVNMAEQYCDYSSDLAASLAPSCISATCNDTCIYSSSSPLPTVLTQFGTFGSGVTTPSDVTGPSSSNSDVFQFEDSFVAVSSSNVSQIRAQNGFSFAAWIKQNAGNSGAIISKSISNGADRTYAISVTENSLTFNYHPSSLVFGYSTLTVTTDLSSTAWHHITVTVFDEDFALYVNGTVVNATGLVGAITDSTNTIYLGQIAPGIGRYNGLMQDIYYYSQALTEREVEELATGSFPYLHLSSNCHCPPSHPVSSSLNIDRCIQHTGVSTGRGSVTRINSNSHTAGYANDNVYTTNWVSAINQKEVNFTMSLVSGSQSAYEIIFAFINYGAPAPKAAILQKSIDGGKTFQPLQYFADDCQSYFGLTNNDPLTSSTDVNCITEYSSQTPLTGVTATVRFLDANVRPGNINTDPELQQFLSADSLQITLLDFFTDNTTTAHRYYDIVEIIIAGRCACNGHAPRCSNDLRSVCECTHFTQGDRCDQCLPLYNDKPWRAGTLSAGFPCKLCTCNNHATSCYYNATLDPFPDSYEQGGGGVCINCQDNTDGTNCELCADEYYRPADVSQSDSSPCSSCDCNSIGSTGTICVKSEGIPGQVVGQCPCKTNVRGRTCNECNSGFYNLSNSNSDGCQPCNCNTDGTVGGSQTCNTQTGQCSCKLNVEGLKCDTCINGTRGLSASDPNGCSICNCNTMGSMGSDCDQLSGQCTCKVGVTGVNCDTCRDGFYNLSSTGCQSCSCSSQGSVNSSCSSNGTCYCLSGFTGINCDMCDSGFYNYTGGCLPCTCNSAGSSDALQCNITTGQCSCKTNVQGRTCDTCRDGFTNLQSSNTVGCSPCDCVLGNVDTPICNPSSSQCSCLSHASGLRCDSCQNGYYPLSNGTCRSCDCNLRGSFNSTCTNSGQCYCNMTSGLKCDTCGVGQYGFPNCLSCQCNSSGSIDTVCNETNGLCYCKDYVTGMNCDTCLDGYQRLQAVNPFGCTKAPVGQSPPFISSRTSISIQISWSPPSQPNGVIELYRLYRNGELFTSVPRSTITYNDTGLSPNTEYAYEVESVNIIGSVRSNEFRATTLEASPEGVNPPSFVVINATSVQAQWQAPNISNGAITEYRLDLIAVDGSLLDSPMNTFNGLAFSTVIGSLEPFSLNRFVLEACTSVGCGASSSVSVRTAEEAPSSQSPPNVESLNSSSVRVSWSSPSQPNGIIVRYEVYQRNTPFTSSGVLVSTVDPSSDGLSVVVSGLEPFTLYEFSVIAYTSAGGRQSDWTRERTNEQEPQGVVDPTATALSSSSIQVTWTSPSTPNGNITQYQVYLQYSNGSSLSLINSTEIGSYTVSGLTPFTRYHFYVLVCNGAGCTSSSTVTVTTLESVPQGLSAPLITNTTGASLVVTWSPPSQPNGDITSYNITRRRPSLLPTPLNRDLGVSFYGTGHLSFPTITEFSGSTTSFSLMFKTSQPNGLLVYFIDSSMTDMFAIELRHGIPWFIFDAGTGPAAITLNGSATFNDSAWHRLVATKDGTDGMLTVDGKHTGTGSSLGGNRFLGEPTAVYFGGIPSNAPKMSQSGHLNTNATIVGRNFAGCLYDAKVSNALIDLNSRSSEDNEVTGQGCPFNLGSGVSFIGGGHLIMTSSFVSPGSNSFSLSLSFRTLSPSGLLFFSYTQGNGSSYLMISLLNSNIVLNLKDASSGNIIVVSTSGLSFPEPLCNGQWHTMQITKESDGVIVDIDNTNSVSKAFTSLRLDLTSNLLLGGIPSGSEALSYISGGMVDSFSGCLRGLIFDSQAINMNNNRISQKHVRYFGCEYSSTISVSSCQREMSTFTVSNSQMYNDTSINAFTEYIYRVSAINSVGATYSQWTSTITGESTPRGISQVSIRQRSSSSLSVSWNRPNQPNGIITKYQLTATPVQSTGLSSPLGNTSSVTIDITEPSQSLTAQITQLYPATNYSLTIVAFTSVGSSPIESTSYSSTLEDVPIGVSPPTVTERTSTSFDFTITPPTQPNGIVTFYRIYIDGDLLTTTNLSISARNLSPFTEYSYYVQACTAIGCTNSSLASNTTLSAPPTGLSPPSLSPLSPTSIEASWSEPLSPNGVISRYELIREDNGMLLFNGSDLQAIVTLLSPNTPYQFKLIAYNMAGSVTSAVSSIVTPEGVPDLISPPNITVLNSSSLYVTWDEPSRPNGNILNYTVLLDRVPVFTGLVFEYTLTDLQPFTTYRLSIQSCTVQGCGNSTQTNARTGEATPEGYIGPTVTSTNSDSIGITINEVGSPNGIVYYQLSMTGEYLVNVASNSTRQTIIETRVVYNDTLVPGNVMVSSLLPFTQYQLVLSVINGAGTLSGEPFTVTTDSAAPQLQGSPILFLATPTSINVTWSPPRYPNGLLTNYTLTIKLTATSSDLILSFPPNTTTALVQGLAPYTNYSVTVTAINDMGSTVSTGSPITTGETAPSSFDQVTVLSKDSVSLFISWDPPSNPNGVILNYTVHVGTLSIATVLGDTYQYNLTGLEPFTEYNISVMVCNSAGCVLTSPVVTDRTEEAAPEGVSTPDLFATTSGSVIITWSEPSTPNGIIQSYTVYKALQTGPFSSLTTVPASSMRRYNDSNVTPFTQYQYYIEATNNAGSTSGDPMTISTSEAAPQGVLSPDLQSLSSSSIFITIYRPTTPNGIITQYTLTRTSPGASPVTLPSITPHSITHTNVTFTDTQLSPFTNYTYTVTACTGIGCTTGPPSSEVTLEAPPTGLTPPSTRLQDDFTIIINWTPPSQPNGIITNYTLIRSNIGFTLGASILNCCEESILPSYCTIVTRTGPSISDYTDSTLYPYSYYSYCLLVTNNGGSSPSNYSTAIRTGVGAEPLSGPNITSAISLNATAIYVAWSSPGVDQLLGPLVDYSLEYSEGEGESVIVRDISTEEYTITGLVPSTVYTITVNVSNGRGDTPGPEVTVMTRDGIPTGLSPPIVTPISSSSLNITFNEPLSPNGIVILYSILLNSVIIRNETTPGTYQVNDLSPYTLYTAQIRVCTSYGCNETDLTSNRTLQSAPTGFASPIVTVLDPYSVNVSWSHPTQENGIITNYLIYVRQTIICPLDTIPPCYNTTLLQSLDYNTNPLTYTATRLIPATSYGFAITAINQGGNASSGFTTITTQEAPPTFVTPPLINSSSSNQLTITWTPPTQPNGIITSYTLYRDGEIVFGPSITLTHTSTGLLPYTVYSYTLQVCTNGGCTNSSIVSGRTLQATPTGFGDPIATEIQDTSLTISWTPPTSPNGIIRYYEVYFGNDTYITNTTSTSYTVINLNSFTNYSFYITACNSADCAVSDVIYVLTNESLPIGVAITTFSALAFNSIEIQWSPPTRPNGIILRYILLRGNQIIFQGNAFQYIDDNLEGGVAYTYTVQAVNSAGSTSSAPITVTTPTHSPTGISAPVLTVLSSTEIFVQWSEPEKANGIISSYRVYVNNTLTFQGLVFNTTLSNLAPYTSYVIRIEVCTVQNDCGNSPSVVNTTEQDRPTGITPPSLSATSHNTVSVSWTAPSSPNGIIRFYRVMRRLADNTLVVIFAYAGGPSVFMFSDRNLLAYTRYEYQLVVVNDAGSSSSTWVQVTTLEDSPANVSAPSFPSVFPYNVSVTWDTPLFANGIITRYQVFYRLLLGEFVLGADVLGNVSEAIVTGLQPHTPYDFKIRAHNDAGTGDSPVRVVVTSEAPPQMLRLLFLVSKTSESLTLTWLPPLQPNGLVREYVLYLNGTEEYRDSATTFTITRLKPYTGYSIQLEACTNAGCTLGPTQGFTTSESSPVGQPAPVFSSVESRSILVTWGPPLQPNGIIRSYEVFRMQVPEPLVVNGTDGALLVHSTNDVATRSYQDTSLSPNTGYQYAIRANNSIGASISSFVYIMTAEDSPEDVPSPNVLSLSTNQLQVSWDEPGLPNGIITLYQVYRLDPSNNVSSVEYSGMNRFFVDSGLSPYTQYRYTVQACTQAGCTNGSVGSNTTDQSIPEGFTVLVLRPVSNSIVSATWESPSTPNGVLLPYIASITSPINVTIPTNDLTIQFTNLQPYTVYTINVQSCTVIGCVSVGPNTVRTLESIPFLLSPPTVVAISPTAVSAQWSPPARPNGLIIRYILRRNDTIVYDGNGTNTSYIDTGLLPNRPYSYDLQAFTSVGGGDRSSVVMVTTQSDTPTDINAPTLTALDSTSVLATWTSPGTPNGIIRQYILYQRFNSVETVAYNGTAMSRAIHNLNIYTQYMYRVEACTTTCGSSLYSTVTTLEDSPTGQAPPMLQAFNNESILVTWDPPLAGNGIIQSYSLERRQVLSDGVFGSVVTVASPLSPYPRSFLDTTDLLEPALTFQYRVGVANSVGSVTSDYSSITLPDAPPEGVASPVLINKTSLSFAVSVAPPTKPNGAIILYRLHSTSFLPISFTPDSQVSGAEFHIIDLRPYTTYSIYIDTCTSAGCTSSSSVAITTEEDMPTDLAPPLPTVTSSTGIRLDWSPPVHPNGLIISYSLWYKLPCPQPQVFPVPLSCLESDYTFIGTTSGLSYDFTTTSNTGSTSVHPYPFTSYQFILEAENNAGRVNSTESTVATTLVDVPQVIGDVSFTIYTQNQSIALNWTNTFRLNGVLRHFIVIRDGFFLLQGTQRTHIFGGQPIGTALQFSVKVVTENGEVTTPSYPLFISGPTTNSSSTTISVTPTITTTDSPTDDTPFYQQFPFIVAVIIVLLLICFVCFLVLLCFIRPKNKRAAEKYDVSTLKSQGSPVRNDGTVRASWMEPRITPIPSYHDVVPGHSSTRLKTSSSAYSPSKVALLSQDYNEGDIPLLDTHISRLSKTDLFQPNAESILGPTPPPFVQDEDLVVDKPPSVRGQEGEHTPNSTISNSPSPPPPLFSQNTDDENAFLDTKI